MFQWNSKLVDFDSKEYGSHFLINERKPGNSLEKSWNFKSRKVGPCVLLTSFTILLYKEEF